MAADPALDDSEWLTCIAVVRFDIELGQTLDMILPKDPPLSKKERATLCFLSFPDSASGQDGDQVYSFCLQTVQAGTQYAYALFRQCKDESVERGFFQQSVVLLSPHSYVTLFERIVGIVAPLYFAHGEALLESIWMTIAAWPAPAAGAMYELPIMGTVLTARIAHSTESGSSISAMDETKPRMPKERACLDILPMDGHVYECSVFHQDIDLVACFRSMASRLWLLWELVLTGQPLMVLSPSAKLCSHTVYALASLIAPLRYAGQIRPFMTINDPDFKLLASAEEAPDSCIVGASNPFFAKAFKHFPHVLVVGDAPKSTVRWAPGPRVARLTGEAKFREEFATKAKTHVPVDKQLVKDILSRTATSNSIRRHFWDLTSTFLLPLDRYFWTLLPLVKNIQPYAPVPNVAPFSETAFVNNLESTKSNKSAWISVYRKFINSQSFAGWFQAKCDSARPRLAALYRESLRTSDIMVWIKRLNDNAEDLDLLHTRALAELDAESKGPNPEEALMDKIKRDADRIQLYLDHLQASVPPPAAGPGSSVASPRGSGNSTALSYLGDGSDVGPTSPTSPATLKNMTFRSSPVLQQFEQATTSPRGGLGSSGGGSSSPRATLSPSKFGSPTSWRWSRDVTSSKATSSVLWSEEDDDSDGEDAVLGITAAAAANKTPSGSSRRSMRNSWSMG